MDPKYSQLHIKKRVEILGKMIAGDLGGYKTTGPSDSRMGLRRFGHGKPWHFLELRTNHWRLRFHTHGIGLPPDLFWH